VATRKGDHKRENASKLNETLPNFHISVAQS
jgi:hypothetical protein